MKITFSQEDITFREQVRDFLTHKAPQHVRQNQIAGLRVTKDDMVAWQQCLFDQGWAGINWPVEHGGTGWSSTQKYIFFDEASKASMPRIIPFGLNMVAPVIYKFGNQEQQQRFLPDILSSKVWWCQGYSEPNAGSDLASLSTKAERQGDHYLVNGTKTWTTLAQHADWIFCLVRTDNSGRKQQGISFLLIDMTTPGITVQPIITIDGQHEVNEVHFDNVQVPINNLVGEEGKGWTYAKVLLTHERTGIARVAESKQRFATLKARIEQLKDTPDQPHNNGVFMTRVTQVEIDLVALEYTELRVLSSIATGNAPGPESSILKILGTELQQALDELFMDLSALHALPFVPEQYDAGFSGETLKPKYASNTAPHYYNNRKVSIYGGSNEVQKNIIAKQILGF